MSKDELISLIKNICLQLDTLDEYLESISEQKRKVDYELSDLLHFIENNDIKAKDSNKLIKLIKEKRLIRRDLNKQDSIKDTYNNNISRLALKNNRQFLLSEVLKKEKSLETEYRYRELDENELKEL